MPEPGSSAEFQALISKAVSVSQEGRHEEAISIADKVIALARELGDGPKIGRALEIKGRTLVAAERWAEAAAVFQESADQYAAVGDTSNQFIALINVAVNLATAGRFSEALSAAEATIALARELGDQAKIQRAMDIKARVLAMAGIPPDHEITPQPWTPPAPVVKPKPVPRDPWRIFPQRTPVATLSRNPDQMDLFAVGRDGAVCSIWWNGLWREQFRVGTRTFPAGTPIATLSRNPDQMDLFAVGDDGIVYSTFWHGSWHTDQHRNWYPIGSRRFPRQTPIAVLARNPDQMDLFAVGDDGIVYSTFWHGSWHTDQHPNWYPIGSRRFPRQTPIAVLARNPDQMDLFAVGDDGIVYSTFWHGSWHTDQHPNWYPIGNAAFEKSTPVTALSRNSDHMEVWAVGLDGGVYGNWWDGQWHDWFRVGSRRFPRQTPIAALSRNPDQMDLFAVGEDGVVYSTFWHGSWHTDQHPNWYPVGDAVYEKGTPIATLSRNPDQMDLFAVGRDGAIHSAWWHGQWHDWFRLPWAVATFSRAITSGGLAALGGWATVALLPDGSTRWYGHARNSGADNYDFGISAILRGDAGAAIAFSHHGRVSGTFSSGSRSHDWDEWHPPHPVVIEEFGHFHNGKLESSVEYSSDITSALETTVGWALKWMVGSSPLLTTLGAVIFAAGTVGSLISEGSAVPGARAVGPMLWMAGPTNSVLAIAAEGIASVGSRTRELTEEEYTWADERVFRGTLPPRERLVLTDTIGKDNRAFCLPRFDGKITINMGSGSFVDPRIHHNGRYGETFVHELVHSWQIQHTAMGETLLARALAAQINKELGGDPYTPGPAGPAFGEFNLEQQAKIVGNWCAKYHPSRASDPDVMDSQAAISDPYFRYIARNIRTGTPS